MKTIGILLVIIGIIGIAYKIFVISEFEKQQKKVNDNNIFEGGATPTNQQQVSK